MEFFCYHGDRPGSAALRSEMLEEHWSYMDRYTSQMIARGPTFIDGGDRPSGSVHIVDLPDPAAARAFAFDEPTYQAGVYRDVLLRRWRNELGRTMWDFPGGRTGGNRYLVLGLGERRATTELAVPPSQDELIAYGPLLPEDNGSQTCWQWPSTCERCAGFGWRVWESLRKRRRSPRRASLVLGRLGMRVRRAMRSR
jgi:uncharacterized protein